MTRPADSVYAKTRTDLVSYEAAAFAALRSYVPNFFRDGREDTLWGWHLRGIAAQLAKIDFYTRYVIRGVDPAFLTPADLLRRYAGPLRLNRNFPGTSQFDTDFKVMILKLLEAYRLGATCESIEKVISAYTGSAFEVEELFQKIGAYYDQSDRNAIKIGVQLSQGEDISSQVTDVARVKDLVTDLYTAIDLAKPAHVGINLTTVMQEDPDIVILQITDELQITMLLTEAEPLDPMLYQAPFLNASTPDTGLAPAILTLTYHWFKDGVAVGGNSPTLTLTDLQLSDNGAQVWALIEDTVLGKVWSKKAVISVHDGAGHGTSKIVPQQTPEAPATDTLQVTAQPFSRVVLVGGNADFTVSAQNSVVPGLLSPRINRAWEIQDDTLTGLDLD